MLLYGGRRVLLRIATVGDAVVPDEEQGMRSRRNKEGIPPAYLDLIELRCISFSLSLNPHLYHPFRSVLLLLLLVMDLHLLLMFPCFAQDLAPQRN